MSTQVLMGSSSVFMAVLGVSASFFPQEILAAAGSAGGAFERLAVQVAGAHYIGFAALNWMKRGSPIGGIYSRPVALGNLLHFTLVTFALWKAVLSGVIVPGFAAAAVLYTVFAVWFGVVTFTHPAREGREPD